VSLTAVNAISAMVAPVVLLTTGGMLSNGLLGVYSAVNDRMRDMTRERIEIVSGPRGELLERTGISAIGQERLGQIEAQIPLMLRRHRLTRASVLTIYSAIAVLGLSIIGIAVAVGLNSEPIARAALGLVLAGTVIMILGLGVAAMSLAKSADAINYAVEQTQSLGQLTQIPSGTTQPGPAWSAGPGCYRLTTSSGPGCSC
jgi:hypothetical protein